MIFGFVEISEPQVSLTSFEKISLECRLSDGDNASTCTWINPSGESVFATSGSSCSWELNQLSSEHRGVWTCKIFTDRGDILKNTTEIYFVQKSKPIITRISKSEVIEIKDDTVKVEDLKCSLSNPSPLTKFVWSLNGEVARLEERVSLPQGSKVPEIITDTLENIPVNRDTSGDVFGCTAVKLYSNGTQIFPSSVQSNYTFNIIFSPQIQSMNISKVIGTATFRIHSNPPISRGRIFDSVQKKNLSFFKCLRDSIGMQNCSASGQLFSVSLEDLETSSFQLMTIHAHDTPRDTNLTVTVSNGFDQTTSKPIYIESDTMVLTSAVSSSTMTTVSLVALSIVTLATIILFIFICNQAYSVFKHGEYAIMNDILETEV